MIEKAKIHDFKEFIWDFYKQNGRNFVWRNIDDPYKIVVSEIMLQQTQTHRVVPKYQTFIATFPTFESLSCASLHNVLAVWQGLGYNRRGAYLHQIAQKVVKEHNGVLPNNPELLVQFPGIGPATAASICAFAFNNPTTFIETNVRAVYIHSFFANQEKVSDKDLLPLIAQTVDQDNPREWYYALMDYGVYLKAHTQNPSRKSAHYTKQSKFEGSDRQIRGKIIKALTIHAALPIDDLAALMSTSNERFDSILKQLLKEKLVESVNNIISIHK